jgi:hypothetical protein
MAAKHGTRRCYVVAGCRCDDCREANRVYCAELRQRHANGEVVGRGAVMSLPVESGPGPVEVAVQSELAGLSTAELRPAIAAAALALARVLDGRAVSSHPSAARVLTKLLDELRKPTPGRKGALKLVRQMSNPRPSEPAKPPVGT